MAHQPILRPDDSEKPESSERFSRDPVISEIAYPFLELTNTFAAHGAGVVSADLALDLILNDIVEQACGATGASGAAIALVRGDEMVCRASTGADAPGLGVRLDIHRGLAGACVKERALQLCDDAENDARADAEASRQGGIRSILMLPLMEDEEVFGVFEIFSPRPNAFEELDVITLKALAQQIVENRRQAYETTNKLEGGALELRATFDEAEADVAIAGSTAASSMHTSEIHAPDAFAASVADAGLRGQKSSPVPVDFWTAFLAVLVIGAAVLMGTLVGWRLGLGQRVGARDAITQRSAAAEAQPVATRSATPTAAAISTAPTESVEGTSTSSTPSALLVPRHAAPSQSTKTRSNATAQPPVGGLVVYEKGRMIYRMRPSSEAEMSAERRETQTNQDKVSLAAQISPEARQVAEQVAAARLIHRVEPQYPADAKQQRIEGPVILTAEISPEGIVQQLSVLKGDAILAASALQAVKQWRYQPYTADGHPVGMRTIITLNFALPAN